MMRAAIIGLCVLGSAYAAPASSRLQFEAFKKEHKRVYASPEEEATRFGIFSSNLERIRDLAKRNPSATFGVTQFADRSEVERRAMRGPQREAFSSVKANAKAAGKPAASKRSKSSLPPVEKIDWQARGAVTAVQNQGQCGSSYIFSATGSIEGQWYLAGNPLTAVSNEELTDCDSNDSGCNGGMMANVYEWILANQSGRIVTNASYPYTAGSGNAGTCQWNIVNNASNVGAIISGYQLLPSGDEMGVMRTFVSHQGPLSVGIDATVLEFYTGGVLTDCTCSSMDHASLITGFDAIAQVPYWRIRNQWGTTWGEAGYFRIEMGSNQCCVDQYPNTAIVGGTPTSPPSTTAPAWNTWQQMHCEDPACSINCNITGGSLNVCSPPTNAAIPTLATCSTGAGLTVTYFPYSNQCNGESVEANTPLGSCVPDNNNGYTISSCSSSP